MAAETQLTWDQVLAWRLAQQRLDGPRRAPVDAVELVGHLAGVQTQVESSAAQVLAVRGRAASTSTPCCGRTGPCSRRGPCAARCTCCPQPSGGPGSR